MRRDRGADQLHGPLAEVLPVDGARVSQRETMALLLEVKRAHLPRVELVLRRRVEQALVDGKFQLGQVVTAAGLESAGSLPCKPCVGERG